MVDAPLVALWLDADGVLHRAHRDAGGERLQCLEDVAKLYFWTDAASAEGRVLSGPGALNRLVELAEPQAFQATVRSAGEAEVIRPYEQQWLVESKQRLFAGLRFADLRRCQLEVASASSEPGSPSDPARPGDRILAIGLWLSHEDRPRILRIAEMTDGAERQLLKEFNALIADADPDIIEGHAIYNSALHILRGRCRRYRVNCAWGRFGGDARFRSGRLRVAERTVDFRRCDLPGRTVFDTCLALQLYDVSARDLSSYALADAARYFGITPEEARRRDLGDDEPSQRFAKDPDSLAACLGDRLREVRGLAERLLPSYVAQVQNFPMLLQEACLRGSAQKVEMLLLERYYQAGEALPRPVAVESYAGGFSKSFGEGVFQRVLHFDVASLYPSLLLQIGRNPVQDSLGALVPLLRDLREYRLEYKQQAREAEDPGERAEFNARQTSFKILINSFYGYLGFSGARFADSELAAEVTARGRELLQALIAWFENEGLRVLEADTDGLYVEGGEWYEEPEGLLARAQAELPEGIDLELDGRYPSMFCYKAKNYALFDGDKIHVRGSALRSRGTEPFLRELTERLIGWLLGAEEESPEILLGRFAAQIEDGSMPVEKLLRSEHLSMSPAAYAARMEAGGKPRRAALEVALKLEPPPRMGDRVRYYIGPREKGMTADWQRAFPLEAFDEVCRPYDPRTYLKKLRDWEKRYRPFFEKSAGSVVE